MALTIVDNRIILDECDATTGWTATDGPTVFTAAPSPVEASGCLAMQASDAVEDAYTSITSDDYSGGGSLSILMADRAEFASTATGGIGIVVGDGTNRIAYHVGGNDGTGFRHDVGSVKWAAFQLDLANKPANFTAITGSEASLNEAAITQVGVRFDTDAKSVGGADNVFWDIIRFADNGVGIEFYGGTVGTPETWDTLTVADRSTANQDAHYLIRLVGTGAYDIQGNINIGDPTSTNDTYINSDTETFLFGDRRQSANNYYRFNCSGNATGTTDVNFDSCIFNNALSGSMDFSDANVTADVRLSTLIGWDQGILTGGSGNVWTGNIYSGCGLLTTTGANISGGTFTGFTGIADDSQVFWNSTTNPGANLDNCSFTMVSGTATHAIEFPTGFTTGTIDLTGINFSGYNAANAANDSVLNFLGTTGSVTVNVSGGSGTVSYKTAGTTITVVNAVTVTLTGLRDNTEVRVMQSGSNTVELAGTESATAGTADDRSFAFSIAASTSVDIYIVNVTYENIEIEGYVIPGSATSLPQQQRFDRSYLNN